MYMNLLSIVTFQVPTREILVSDFDQTFYSKFFLKNVEKIKEFVQQGNIFIIATGRNYTQLMSDLRHLSVPVSFYICDDGALIYDFYGNLIYKNELEKEMAEKIYHELSESKHTYDTWYDDGIDYTVDIGNFAVKIISKPKDYDKCETLLEKLLKKYPMVHGYLSENWVNITNKSATKGNAIEYLTKEYVMDENQIYTIGDNVNDLSMFEKYHSFALEDGISIAKEKAKYVVKDFCEVFEHMDKED